MELVIFLPLLLLIRSGVIPGEASADALHHHGELDTRLQVRARYVLLHPPTGECVIRDLQGIDDPLLLGPCSGSDSWYYTPQQLLMIKGTYFCLQASGAGEQLQATARCSPQHDTWEIVTRSTRKSQIMKRLSDSNETSLCLEAAAGGGLVSEPCRCMPDAIVEGGGDESCDVDSQWFSYHNEQSAAVGE